MTYRVRTRARIRRDPDRDVVTQILDEVLNNDDEIRTGAVNVGVELEDLKFALLRRQQEVLDACLAERNRLAEYTEIERPAFESFLVVDQHQWRLSELRRPA